MQRQWIKLFLLSCLIAVSGLFLVIGYKIYDTLTRPMLAQTSAPVIIVVDKNTSASVFVHRLKKKQLIRSSRLLLTIIRLEGIANRLKAGIYQIVPGQSVAEFLDQVVKGKVLVESFRIIEGTTLNQIVADLKQAPFLKYNATDWQFITDKYPNPEGLLLADTYNYNGGSDAKPLLQLAHQKLEQFLNYSWQNRNPDLPYKSSYELLVAASILEKETSLNEEKRIIAGVIINRIKKNMPLQMDPTVIYALGPSYTGKLTHENMSVDSPYNTYRYRGLPPTPIAMVGKAAIEAAAHPLTTNYLYFVAKGDGSHHFSATYEEQREAITRYQKEGL
ncbi:endolytic transglycosylase MltG [Legionella fairfieldensis]|uniref:endolytic transglycosylase MltG n=1 Tax=Legionella fairfieldensis TaxID=45064 RepID=UPI00048CED82|nr:endolytic transglycosylase MltG [Legionella fairfieldensis]